jgi:hypothetical protein
VVVLNEKIDNGNPETKEQTHPHAKSEGRSLFKFSHDPAKVEREAGWVANNARQVQLATGEGGLSVHRSRKERRNV